MRIKKIQNINIGPFKNFHWNNALSDFDDKVNIILGWNGTGKTIISRILRTFEKGEIKNKKIDGATFTISFDSGSRNQHNLTGLENDIRVFNEDYIKNILSQPYLDYVIALGEEAIDFSEKEKELDVLESEYKKIKCKNRHDEIARNTADVIRRIPGIGHIKKELEDGIYNSYYAPSFVKRINWLKNKIEAGNSIDNFIKSDSELDVLVTQLNNQSKKEEEYKILKKWNDWVIEINEKGTSRLENINKILDFIPNYEESKRISKYGDWSDEGKWIRKGVDIHKLRNAENQLNICLFCNSPINNKDELLKHFSDDVLRLTKALDDYENIIQDALTKISGCNTFFQKEKDVLEKFFNNFLERIVQKKKNMFKTVEQMKFNNLFKMEEKFDLREIAWKVEISYVAERYEEYFKEMSVFMECQKNQERLTDAIKRVKSEIKILKEKASNVHIPKEQLNKLLRITFPHKKIELEDSSNGIGYILKRNGLQCNLEDLSEGERNFLALAYFLLSINTNDENKKLSKNGIVVIDDPVSSLDSDFLFQVYSILLGEIKTNPKRQYFVLTHNLEFFGHLHKQFKRKDENGNLLGGFYQIIFDGNGARIDKLSDRLSNYSTDYQYAIAQLHELKDSDDLNDKIFAANLLRRVLETFLHFKYGKGDLYGKLEKAYLKYRDLKLEKILSNIPEPQKELRKNEIIKDIESEKEVVYRFVNYGSHEFLGLKKIDISVLNGSKKCIKAFFDLVRTIDKDHYESFKL